MNVCIFCATPYHVLLAIQIAKTNHSDENTDIVIYDHFDQSETICEALKDTDIFSNVKYLKNRTYDTVTIIKKSIMSFVPNKIINDIANNSHYEKMIMFVRDTINYSYIIKKYKKRGINCDFSFGDDGIGTYISKTAHVPSKKSKIVLKILGRGKYIENVNSIYVVEPKCLSNEICACSKCFSNIIKIDCSNIDKTLSYAKEHIWRIPSVKLQKAIYLQEALVQDIHDEEDIILKRITTIVDQSNFCIKLHPRTFSYNTDVTNNIIRTKAPFECLISDTDFEQTVIISLMSTASVTPTLLSGQVPYQIFLYKLFPNLTIKTEIESFFVDNKDYFGNKVYVPGTMEELEANLLEIDRKIVLHK